MWRARLALLLGVILISGSAMAADMLQEGMGLSQRKGLVGPTQSGHYFSMRITASTLHYYVGGNPAPDSRTAQDYPFSADLTVRVQNAQGQPANGVPVAFELAPKSQLKGKVLVSSAKATSKEGIVKVKVSLADKVGQSARGLIVARIENMTTSLPVVIQPSPERSN